MPSAQTRTLVIGAQSMLGAHLADALEAQGGVVLRTSRNPPIEPGWRRLDLDDSGTHAAALEGVDAVAVVPTLTKGVRLLPALRAAKIDRALFFSSNNVAIDLDAPVYRALRAAEDKVRGEAPCARILRPTMIYGHGRDGNVARLLRLLVKSPALPLPGGGRALQQPIHFKDLAAIAADLIARRDADGGLYAAGGPEPMSLRAMAETARDALGARTPLIPVPDMLFRLTLHAARLVRGDAPLDPAQAARAGSDKTPVFTDARPPPRAAGIAFDEGLTRQITQMRAAGLLPPR